MEQLEKHRRPRRTKREKLEEELLKLLESAFTFEAAAVPRGERREVRGRRDDELCIGLRHRHDGGKDVPL